MNNSNSLIGVRFFIKKQNTGERKFEKIINHISDKVQGLFGDKDKEKYEDITNDLYMNDIIDKKDYNKINVEKEKDDFYR